VKTSNLAFKMIYTKQKPKRLWRIYYRFNIPNLNEIGQIVVLCNIREGEQMDGHETNRCFRICLKQAGCIAQDGEYKPSYFNFKITYTWCNPFLETRLWWPLHVVAWLGKNNSW